MTTWLVVIPSADTYQEMGIKKGPPKVMHLIFCVIDILLTVRRPRSGRFGSVRVLGFLSCMEFVHRK